MKAFLSFTFAMLIGISLHADTDKDALVKLTARIGDKFWLLFSAMTCSMTWDMVDSSGVLWSSSREERSGRDTVRNCLHALVKT